MTASQLLRTLAAAMACQTTYNGFSQSSPHSMQPHQGVCAALMLQGLLQAILKNGRGTGS